MPEENFEMLDSPGIVRDTPAHKLPANAFSDGKNFVFNDDGAQTIAGNLDALSQAEIMPLWLQAFPPINNPTWVYGNLEKLYAVNGSTHTEITRASGDYAGQISERWNSTIFNGLAVFNNAVDLPQAWTTIQSSTQLIDLPNWNTDRRAKVIRTFKNYLVALNLTDSGTNRPYRVLWSDSANVGTLPGSWDSTDPTTDSREFDLAQTPDHLIDCLPLGDINIIYKETSTWGMRFVGPGQYFSFWKILDGRGLLTRDCAVNVPQGQIAVTQDDIILHQGQVGQDNSILSRRDRRSLFSNIDTANFRQSFVLADFRKNEFYFCYPELGEVYANKILVWNWDRNTVSFTEIPSTPFGAVGPVGENLIDDLEWS